MSFISVYIVSWVIFVPPEISVYHPAMVQPVLDADGNPPYGLLYVTVLLFVEHEPLFELKYTLNCWFAHLAYKVASFSSLQTENSVTLLPPEALVYQPSKVYPFLSGVGSVLLNTNYKR